jgi:hypothetical protein
LRPRAIDSFGCVSQLSILLQAGLQAKSGIFKLPLDVPVPSTAILPGVITIFSSDMSRSQQQVFAAAGPYKPAEAAGSLVFGEYHGTPLGENLYLKFENAIPEEQPFAVRTWRQWCAPAIERSLMFGTPNNRQARVAAGGRPRQDESSAGLAARPHPLAVPPMAAVVNKGSIAALDVLSGLLGAQAGREMAPFRLDLFDSPTEDEGQRSVPSQATIVPVASGAPMAVQVATQGADAELRSIMQSFDQLSRPSSTARVDDDLLTLLDMVGH